MSRVTLIPREDTSSIQCRLYVLYYNGVQIDIVRAIEDEGRYYINYGRMNISLMIDPATSNFIVMKDGVVKQCLQFDKETYWKVRRDYFETSHISPHPSGGYKTIALSDGGGYYDIVRWYSRTVYGSGDLIYYSQLNPGKPEIITDATFRDFQRVVLSIYGSQFCTFIGHTDKAAHLNDRIFIFGGKVGVI